MLIKTGIAICLNILQVVLCRSDEIYVKRHNFMIQFVQRLFREQKLSAVLMSSSHIWTFKCANYSKTTIIKLLCLWKRHVPNRCQFKSVQVRNICMLVLVMGSSCFFFLKTENFFYRNPKKPLNKKINLPSSACLKKPTTITLPTNSILINGVWCHDGKSQQYNNHIDSAYT